MAVTLGSRHSIDIKSEGRKDKITATLARVFSFPFCLLSVERIHETKKNESLKISVQPLDFLQESIHGSLAF
jgi:hypothetical protein